MSHCFSAVVVEKYDNDGKLRFATGKLYYLADKTESGVRGYLEMLNIRLGNNNVHQFLLQYYKVGKNGTQHYSFQQAYNDIPVFGRYIRMHINDNMITNLSSNIDVIDLSVVPIITEAASIDIIRLANFDTSTYYKYQKLQICTQK